MKLTIYNGATKMGENVYQLLTIAGQRIDTVNYIAAAQAAIED